MTDSTPATSAQRAPAPERDALYVQIEAAAVVGYSNWLDTGKEIGLTRYITDAVHTSLTRFETLEALAVRLTEIIHERAATWETQFDAGPGDVVSVSDAAWVIAKHLLLTETGDFAHLLETPRYEGLGHDLDARLRRRERWRRWLRRSPK